MTLKRHTQYLIFILSLALSCCSLDTWAQENAIRIQSLERSLDSYAQEYPAINEEVNINLSNTSLSNFLLAVAKVHDINFHLSPALEDITIVNNFGDVSIRNLLIFVAKEYALDFDFTGNIISISPYEPVPPPVQEQEPNVTYKAQNNTISLDLKNIPLRKVFRKITDITGTNLVYSPGMENLSLSIYLKDVPMANAIEKMALANNLRVTKSRDGFYIFNQIVQNGEGNMYSALEMSDNFQFQVLDSIHKVIAVEFRNASSAAVIRSVSEALGVDYYLASPLEDLGNLSFSSDNIHYDQLLQYIFESTQEQQPVLSESVNQNEQGNQNYQSNNRGNAAPYNSITSQNSLQAFTYRKEGKLYFFGYANLLSLKDIAVIPMMHRSVQLLSDPTNNYAARKRNRNSNFVTGNTNYYGSNNYNNTMGNTPYSNNTRNGSGNYDSYDSDESDISLDAIKKIIPEALLQNIHLKIDAELNSFVVTGKATDINRFRDFVEYIDKPVPVILIEVMILEVNKSATVETGVNFGLGEEEIATEGQAFPNTDMQIGAQTVNKVIGGFDGFGSLNLGRVLPNFYMNIKAMESNGNLKVLSTPKLSTLNGHKAHLSSGQTTYYAVTNQNFFGSQIPQTSEITNYYPIDAELALDIQPFVSGNGEITLDINVMQSSFNGERIADEAPPGMNSREFSSIIRMRDQDVAVLGGIEQRTKDDSGSGVPLLARVPIIKWLFSERRREDSKRKLNILIKPTVIY